MNDDMVKRAKQDARAVKVALSRVSSRALALHMDGLASGRDWAKAVTEEVERMDKVLAMRDAE